jgi:hypothetical protein
MAIFRDSAIKNSTFCPKVPHRPSVNDLFSVESSNLLVVI